MQVGRQIKFAFCQHLTKLKDSPTFFLFFHLVRIMSNIKRTGHEMNGKAPYSKRSHLSDNQSSITHVGSPVNPMTAKALASKLLKKPSVQTAVNATKNASAPELPDQSIDLPMPPLVSIQAPAAYTKRSCETDNVQAAMRMETGQENIVCAKTTVNPTSDSDTKQSASNQNHIIQTNIATETVCIFFSERTSFFERRD